MANSTATCPRCHRGRGRGHYVIRPTEADMVAVWHGNGCIVRLFHGNHLFHSQQAPYGTCSGANWQDRSSIVAKDRHVPQNISPLVITTATAESLACHHKRISKDLNVKSHLIYFEGIVQLPLQSHAIAFNA
jgi:hypothetical protein